MSKIIYTPDAPEALGPYSQAVITGGLVFTSGQIAVNPATNAIEAQDIEGQTIQVMKNLGTVLKEAGSSFDKAVKTTCFLRNMSDFAAFNKIYGEYFTSKRQEAVFQSESFLRTFWLKLKLLRKSNIKTKGRSLKQDVLYFIIY